MRSTPPASSADYGANVTPPPDAAGGGGGGAPTDAQYVVLASNGSLSAESVLTAGEGILLSGATVTSNAAALMMFFT